jgi:hypothetical protein
MAFIADYRMVAHLWLRISNTHSANNIFSFLEDTLHKLQVKKIGLLSGDSGFYSEKIFNNRAFWEARLSINYLLCDNACFHWWLHD